MKNTVNTWRSAQCRPVTDRSAKFTSSTSPRRMWPDSILRRFATIPNDNQTEGEYHAPYNKLFHTIFTVDSDFSIAPQYLLNHTLDTDDPTMTFRVDLVDKPLLILHLKSPGDIALPARRQAADDQIRSHMVDIIGQSSSCTITCNSIPHCYI